MAEVRTRNGEDEDCATGVFLFEIEMRTVSFAKLVLKSNYLLIIFELFINCDSNGNNNAF